MPDKELTFAQNTYINARKLQGFQRNLQLNKKLPERWFFYVLAMPFYVVINLLKAAVNLILSLYRGIKFLVLWLIYRDQEVVDSAWEDFNDQYCAVGYNILNALVAIVSLFVRMMKSEDVAPVKIETEVIFFDEEANTKYVMPYEEPVLPDYDDLVFQYTCCRW